MKRWTTDIVLAVALVALVAWNYFTTPQRHETPAAPIVTTSTTLAVPTAVCTDADGWTFHTSPALARKDHFDCTEESTNP